MSKVETVPTDVLCELASAIVERQFYKEHGFRAIHSTIDEHGDEVYIASVQDEFGKVLDILDDILNPDV